jgi:hypothetical protein
METTLLGDLFHRVEVFDWRMAYSECSAGYLGMSFVVGFFGKAAALRHQGFPWGAVTGLSILQNILSILLDSVSLPVLALGWLSSRQYISTETDVRTRLMYGIPLIVMTAALLRTGAITSLSRVLAGRIQTLEGMRKSRIGWAWMIDVTSILAGLTFTLILCRNW